LRFVEKAGVQGGFVMDGNFAIRRAAREDAESIALLLQEAGIDPEGLEQWVESFLLVETANDHRPEIIATAGLEKYGTKGLMRSLVMRTNAWSAEDGLNLLRLILSHASQNGLDEVYLLTESPTLFIHMEFTPLDLADIPPEILSSVHFRQNSSRAVPMRKILK
jgi:amino-acid N-acetyltransferase